MVLYCINSNFHFINLDYYLSVCCIIEQNLFKLSDTIRSNCKDICLFLLFK